jgi:hypothetical protein
MMQENGAVGMVAVRASLVQRRGLAEVLTTCKWMNEEENGTDMWVKG